MTRGTTGRHAGRPVLAVLLRSVVAALMCSFALLGMARAYAADPIHLTISTSVSGVNVQVSGTARLSSGQGIGGLTLSMYVNDVPYGTTATSSDGSYSHALSVQSSGSYLVRVVFSGNSRYSATSVSSYVSVVQVETTLTLSMDPTAITPGASATLTGSLTSGGSPISLAVINLSVDYGSVDAAVGTSDDGSFVAGLAIPEATEGLPERFTVTAVFSGDSVFSPASQQVSGTILVPSPTPAPEASPSSPTPRVATSSASQTTALAGKVNGSTSDSSEEGSSSPMTVVSVVFFAVALVSVGALVILGIVSHAQKRLARDERRGFGTDFGKG